MNKWFWMMDWCKQNGLPPAQLWAWEKAKQAYKKLQEKENKMNLIDLKVIEVLTMPYQEKISENNKKWFIKVKAEAYGRESNHVLMFDTKKEAQEIKPGYIFQG